MTRQRAGRPQQKRKPLSGHEGDRCRGEGVRLTKKQRQLTDEVKYLLDLLKLSSDVSEVDQELRTTHLELARRELVTSGVLSRYVLMDELLNDVICREFFPRDRSYPQL